VRFLSDLFIGLLQLWLAFLSLVMAIIVFIVGMITIIVYSGWLLAIVGVVVFIFLLVL
jgi:hypothetical protein